jgi:hypothetical protein
LIASSLMFVGVLLLCLPFTFLQAGGIAALSLGLMVLYLLFSPAQPLASLAEEAT